MESSLFDFSKVKINIPQLAVEGWKGTMRSTRYIKAHNGKAHPFSLLFGPLGGLLIPDNQLISEKNKTAGIKSAKDLIPASPSSGPPLPSGLNWKWPWSK